MSRRSISISFAPCGRSQRGAVAAAEGCRAVTGVDRAADLRCGLRGSEKRIEDRLYGVLQAAAETRCPAASRSDPGADQRADE
jgi:hypothetical protein